MTKNNKRPVIHLGDYGPAKYVKMDELEAFYHYLENLREFGHKDAADFFEAAYHGYAEKNSDPELKVHKVKV